MKRKTRKHCVELAKKISLSRDGYRCVRCGRTKDQGWQIHGSHILGEGAHPRMSYDPFNIKALCAKCHMWWHSSPTLSGEWFKEKFPEWHIALKKKARESERSIKKPNYNEEYDKLKKYEIT